MTKGRSVVSVFALVVLGLLSAVALTWVWQQTSGIIRVNDRNFKLRALNEIVPATRYDNELFADTIEVHDPDLLGSNNPVTVYRARKNGQPVAIILTVVAHDGYSGQIQLLVGINIDGTIAGVRVSEHHETAGLGDNIELSNSNWILQFDNRSLTDPPVASWAVKKDNGQFDQITGATITPRATIKGIRNALLYFNAHREALFTESPNP